MDQLVGLIVYRPHQPHPRDIQVDLSPSRENHLVVHLAVLVLSRLMLDNRLHLYHLQASHLRIPTDRVLDTQVGIRSDPKVLSHPGHPLVVRHLHSSSHHAQAHRKHNLHSSHNLLHIHPHRHPQILQLVRQEDIRVGLRPHSLLLPSPSQ